MKLYFCPILILALMAHSVSASAEETSPLEKSKVVYEKSLKKIEVEHRDNIRPLNDAYYIRLTKLSDKAMTDGNLEVLKAVKAEEKRFLKEMTVSPESLSDMLPQIAKIQAGYSTAVSKVKKDRDKQILNLLSHYIKRLEALKVAYVRKGDIQNAEVVSKELDGAKEKYKLVRETFGKAMVMPAKIASPKQVSPKPSPKPKPLGPNSKWTSLFDGRTLDKWNVLKQPKEGKGKGGRAHVKNGLLMLERGEPVTRMAWLGDFPKTDYEIEVEAMRLDGDGDVIRVVFPTPKGLVLSGFGPKVGIAMVDGKLAPKNPTLKPLRIKDEHWYKFRIRVEGTRIRLWVDDEVVADIDKAERKVTFLGMWDDMRPFGIDTFSKSAIRTIRIQEVAGDTTIPRENKN